HGQHVLDIVTPGDVGLHGDSDPTLVRDQVRCLGAGFQPVGGNNLRAFSGEEKRDRPTDPLTGTSDNRHTPWKPHRPSRAQPRISLREYTPGSSPTPFPMRRYGLDPNRGRRPRMAEESAFWVL